MTAWSMPIWRTLPALLLLVAMTQAAWAQDRPRTLPTRDVDVTYVLPTPAGAVHQRLRYNAARRLLRLDPPGERLRVVIDFAAQRMFTVRDADRSVIEMAAPKSWMPGLGGARYTRRNADRVSGVPCTDWETTDSEGHAVLICLTEDGVMLRAALGARVLLIATELRREPQAAPVFQVPENYRRLSPPPIQAAQ
jgi:hypothetical protein